MITKKQSQLLIAMNILASSTSFAVPTIYPESINNLSKLFNPTNSNLVADDTDSKTVWVMPPNEGAGSVSGLHTLSAGLSLCGQLVSAKSNAEALSAKVQTLRLQMADKITTIEAFEVKITNAKLDSASYATQNHMDILVQIDASISNANASLLADIELYKTCQGPVCTTLESDMSARQKEVSTLTVARYQFQSKNLANTRIYDQKKAMVQALTEQRDAILENYQNLISKLDKMVADITSIFTSYAAIYGARAQFTYESGWNANISTLRELNPGYNIAPISTENAVIYPSITGAGALAGKDAVIGFEFGGAYKVDGGIGFSSYPGSISGNIALSLIGACPMIYPSRFQLDPGVDPTKMKYGLLATFEFPSTMKMSMKATYNMFKLYQLVKQSGSSGGFFRSRSWTSTEKRNFFRDAFRVDWTIQDPANSITDAQRIGIERDARTAIFSRLLTLALPQTPDKSLLANALPPPARGSVVIADSLMTACPGNMYCVAGAMLLKGLDSIFGSSSSSTSYTQIQDINLTEEWNMNKTVMKPWITNFKM